MVKKLQTVGNSQAIILDKPILEMLNVQAGAEFQLTVSSGALIMTPVNVGLGSQTVDEIFDKLQPRYGEMLQRLAK